MALFEKEPKSGKKNIIMMVLLVIAILILISVGIIATYIIVKKATSVEPVPARVTTTTTTLEKIITYVGQTTSIIETTTTTIPTTTTTTTIIIIRINASCYKDSDCGPSQNLNTCSDDRSEVIKTSIQPMCMNSGTEGAYCWNKTTIAGIVPCTDEKIVGGRTIRSMCFSGGCTKI